MIPAGMAMISGRADNNNKLQWRSIANMLRMLDVVLRIDFLRGGKSGYFPNLDKSVMDTGSNIRVLLKSSTRKKYHS